MSFRSHVPPVLAFVCIMLAGCGGGKVSISTENGAEAKWQGKAKGSQAGGKQGPGLKGCEVPGAEYETSTYDTSGDDKADVRKVFRKVGTAPLIRLVLVCREADLDGDGVKDIVRFYDEDGRPAREEADRDFDGLVEAVSVFQNGEIMRKEIDASGNGVVDTKIFYERGVPIRAERDLTGRSTQTSWKPNRWEYFEEGRMIRMGTDVDADGRVDRWDRAEQAPEAPREGVAQPAAATETAGPAETEGATDSEAQ